MKFVFFRAKFAWRVFPSFWSALKLVLGLPCSLPPSWQLSLFPDDGCLPAYAKNKIIKKNCGLNSVSPRQLVLQWKEISPWPQEMLSTGWAICSSSRPGWRWHSNRAVVGSSDWDGSVTTHQDGDGTSNKDGDGPSRSRGWAGWSGHGNSLPAPPCMAAVACNPLPTKPIMEPCPCPACMGGHISAESFHAGKYLQGPC